MNYTDRLIEKTQASTARELRRHKRVCAKARRRLRASDKVLAMQEVQVAPRTQGEHIRRQWRGNNEGG